MMRLAKVLFLAVLMAGSSVQAAVSVAVGNTGGNPGETVSIPIDLRNDGSLTAMQMDLVYPSGGVSLTAVLPGNLGTDHVFHSNPVGEGKERLVVYSPTNTPLPDSVLASVEVQLLDSYQPGYPAISLSNLRYVSGNGAVLQVALSPFIRITSPTGGTTVSELAQANLAALAVETDGAVTRVEFYANGRKIGMDASAPYSLAWQVDGRGNILVMAVAYDEDGDSMNSPALSLDSSGWAFIESWRQEHFSGDELQDPSINGLLADPEGDSIVNLLEFAFGLDPWTPDAEGAPFLMVDSSGGTDQVALQYRRLADSGPMNYIIEKSSNLTDWVQVPDTLNEVLLDSTGGIETILLEAIEPVPQGQDAANTFVRVRMEVSP